MPKPPKPPKKPTVKQLNYLRMLAGRADQTFTWPHTREEASDQIDRLKGRAAGCRLEQRIEHKQIADAIAAGPADSARVRDDEVHGWGSNATWAHNHDTQPADPGPPAARRVAPQVGLRIELARYTVPAGERVLYGQRVDGIVRLVDRPVAPGGRAYLIERGLETKSELDALIADYRATAERLQAVPMSESPVDRFLGQTA